MPSVCRSFNDLLIVKFQKKMNKYYASNGIRAIWHSRAGKGYYCTIGFHLRHLRLGERWQIKMNGNLLIF